MTDLTDKWKKGELPEGFYFVKDGENMIAEYLDGYFYNNGEPMTSFSGGVDEVLAPVPNYQEYQALLKDKELWIKRCNNARNHQFNAMKDAKTLAQTLLKVSQEHREWLEKNFSEYVEQQKDWVNGI